MKTGKKKKKQPLDGGVRGRAGWAGVRVCAGVGVLVWECRGVVRDDTKDDKIFLSQTLMVCALNCDLCQCTRATTSQKNGEQQHSQEGITARRQAQKLWSRT